MTDIAIICPYDLNQPGGVQGQALLLAKFLRKRGNDVILVAPGSFPNQLIDTDFMSAGPSKSVPANASRAPIGISPVGVERALAKLKYSSDLIHVHEPMAPLVSLLASLNLRGTPKVATCHRAGVDWLYKGAGVLLGSFARRSFHLMTAVSASAAATAREALGRDADVIIPNAVDLGEFQPGFKKPATVPRLLFVGRHEKRKGLDLLLRAAKLLAREKFEFELSVVGKGPMTAYLQSLYRFEGLIWHGRVGRDELLRLYLDSDVFVAPAYAGESFGVTIIEAAAAGCALVLADLPGYREAAGNSALYFPPGGARELKEVLARVLSDKGLRSQLQQLARDRAQIYDINSVGEQYLRAYNLCLSSSP